MAERIITLGLMLQKKKTRKSSLSCRTLSIWRLRPYAILGFGTFVTIHDQNAVRGPPATYGVRPDANVTPSILATVNRRSRKRNGGTSPYKVLLGFSVSRHKRT
jgi:hypothetical protein